MDQRTWRVNQGCVTAATSRQSGGTAGITSKVGHQRRVCGGCGGATPTLGGARLGGGRHRETSGRPPQGGGTWDRESGRAARPRDLPATSNQFIVGQTLSPARPAPPTRAAAAGVGRLADGIEETRARPRRGRERRGRGQQQCRGRNQHQRADEIESVSPVFVLAVLSAERSARKM